MRQACATESAAVIMCFMFLLYCIHSKKPFPTLVQLILEVLIQHLNLVTTFNAFTLFVHFTQHVSVYTAIVSCAKTAFVKLPQFWAVVTLFTIQFWFWAIFFHVCVMYARDWCIPFNITNEIHTSQKINQSLTHTVQRGQLFFGI
jgi:hypothetical protein